MHGDASCDLRCPAFAADYRVCESRYAGYKKLAIDF
jgi:hypothetical protein